MRDRVLLARFLRRAIFSSLATLLLALFAPPAARGQGQGGSLEAAIKATYLYKFAPFVEWPATAFSSPTAPLVICVVGDDDFGDVVQRAVDGQRIAEHAIAFRRLRSVDRDSGCHILYVGGAATRQGRDSLAAVRGTPVLTVTETAPDAQAAGIIRFVLAENRVRFDIDTAAAAENHLAISSKLLNLALHPRATAS